jgi:phytoene dehydrogenase-like protein
LDITTALLEEAAPGDGEAWRVLVDVFARVRTPLLDALFAPVPPVRPALRLARALGLAGGVRFAHLGVTPVRQLAEQRFRGDGAGLLLASNALHSDLSPESAGSGLYGWLLTMLGQWVGYPVPVGGSGALSAAMLARLRDLGGEVACGQRVDKVLVRGGRAVGVRTADGSEHPARRAVLADVDAPRLYRELLPREVVPAALQRDIERFAWDWATVKVDWALDGAIPWTAERVGEAGTVHLAEDLAAMTTASADLACGLLPRSPFLVLGQMTTSDASRSPAGTESAWAYTHVPQRVRGDAFDGSLTGRWDAAETSAYVARMEQHVEQYAPGFRGRVRARTVVSPCDLQDADGNLRSGAINGGTAALHQQLVFRPTPGLGRAETPVPGLYLASASAHPGGGVHGGPGSIAARTALAHHTLTRRGGAALLAAAHRHVQAAP